MTVMCRFNFFSLGNLHNEQDVLEWLRKNRYRQPELNIYMYMLIAISILFLMYTGFLLSCFRSEPSAPVAHPKQAWNARSMRKWWQNKRQDSWTIRACALLDTLIPVWLCVDRFVRNERFIHGAQGDTRTTVTMTALEMKSDKAICLARLCRTAVKCWMKLLCEREGENAFNESCHNYFEYKGRKIDRTFICSANLTNFRLSNYKMRGYTRWAEIIFFFLN